MLSLITRFAMINLLRLGRTEESTARVNQSGNGSRKKSVGENRSLQDLPAKDLGALLAYASRICEVPFGATEYYFVKTGFSPYWHTCVDDFVPMLCPACEWSVRNRELIEWRREALIKLSKNLELFRSTQKTINAVPTQALQAPEPRNSRRKQLP